MSDPVAVPFPQLGDPDYSNQLDKALGRLSEQFKHKKEDAVQVAEDQTTLPLSLPVALGDGSVEDELNNISKFLTAICQTGVQPLVDCLNQLYAQRSISTAVGANLDVIGRIVGQPRNGLDDDTYRRYCRANIFAHRSRGTAEDLLRVADLIVFEDAATYDIQPGGVATVVVTIEGFAVTDDLARVVFTFLQRSASIGIRVLLQYVNQLTPVFQFDAGPGLDVGHLATVIDH